MQSLTLQCLPSSRLAAATLEVVIGGLRWHRGRCTRGHSFAPTRPASRQHRHDQRRAANRHRVSTNAAGGSLPNFLARPPRAARPPSVPISAPTPPPIAPSASEPPGPSVASRRPERGVVAAQRAGGVPGYRRCDLSSQVTEHDSKGKPAPSHRPHYLLMSLYQCSNHLSNCAGGLAARRAGGVGIQARGIRKIPLVVWGGKGRSGAPVGGHRARRAAMFQRWRLIWNNRKNTAISES
jgi:hypothetical protein